MRPGLSPDEMRKLVHAVSERMENGAPFEAAFESVKKRVFPGVDPAAIDHGFKAWCAKQVGVEFEQPAAPEPASEPPADEPKPRGKKHKE